MTHINYIAGFKLLLPTTAVALLLLHCCCWTVRATVRATVGVDTHVDTDPEDVKSLSDGLVKACYGTYQSHAIRYRRIKIQSFEVLIYSKGPLGLLPNLQVSHSGVSIH